MKTTDRFGTIDMVEFKDGRVRSKSATNKEFNPEGLTIGCIDAEIMAAYSSAIPPELQEYLNQSLTKNAHERAAMMSKVDQTWYFSKDLPKGAAYDAVFLQRLSAFGQEKIIQPADEERAVFISKYPCVLLVSLEHQDALSRWQYATHHHWSDKARRRATELMGKALPPSRPSRKGYRLKETALRRAYDDLREYVHLVVAFAQKKRAFDRASVLKMFTDADRLEDGDVNLEDLAKNTGKRNYQPGEIAVRYISFKTDLSRTQFFAKIARTSGHVVKQASQA